MFQVTWDSSELKNFMKSHAAACCSGVPESVMYQAPPPIWSRPGSSMPGTGAAPSTRALGSIVPRPSPTLVGSSVPLRKASTVVAAVEVSIVIDALPLAIERYWPIWPGVSGMTSSSPSADMDWIHWYRPRVVSLSKAAASVVSVPRPLSLLTMGEPAPVSHISISGELTFRATGLSTTPASLIFWAYWRISSRVFGVLLGSSPAAWKWPLL